MPEPLDVALKEWHAVTRALAAGRQCVLIRKGGIHETEGRFEIEQRRFALFPTWLHQKVDWIKPADRNDAVPRTSEPDELTIEAWAEVMDVARVPSRAAMDALDPQHIYLPPLIDMRFSYKPHHPLYLLVVRAWKLASPRTILNTPAYAGCRSWVPLDEAVEANGSTAALADEVFASRRDTIVRRVGGRVVIYFQCNLCRTKLSAQDAAAGQQMRCPNCMSVVSVPEPAEEAVPVEAIDDPFADDRGEYDIAGVPSTAAREPAAASASRQSPPAPTKPVPSRPPPGAIAPRPTQYGKRYGFNCAYCSSRLEAVEGMAGHEGQCPTCGNAITIPILDRYGRLIDPVTRQIIKQDPHPVHAYAAAGDRAPGIVRDEDTGQQQIVCAKCRRENPITSNNCKFCGMPFTMEGTAPDAASAANGFATASLVLGIIGVPFGCTIVVPGLALVFGIIALVRGGANAGRGQAIAGIVCGVLGLGVGLLMYH